MGEKLKIHFLGAAGTVTGSKYLIETPEKKILVDCGLFQGLKKLRLLNWEYLPVDAASIDVVLLTHGHLDHVGFLPRLMKMGFKGPVYGTIPTLSVAEVILKDSAKIQEEGAEKANKEGYSKHKPANPLYDLKDVDKTLSHFTAVQNDHWIEISDSVKARFLYNGHIIGATFIELNVGGKIMVFSGDIGREKDVLMRPPLKPAFADVLFIESTYGDRLHPSEKTTEEKLQRIVNETIGQGGTLIIPSFAVERSQALMYLLWQLTVKKLIPNVPMIMDSPMGANVLKIFIQNLSWHKLSLEDCTQMCKQFQIVQHYQETFQIVKDKQPKIIIAGSGMVSGGRVLQYLEEYISMPETTVLLVGFQAEGTRGRSLLEHATEIKFFGKYFPVKAKIEHLNGLSAHADQHELLGWMKNIKNTPEKIFIVHGEARTSDALRVKIKDTFQWESITPELYGIDMMDI